MPSQTASTPATQGTARTASAVRRGPPPAARGTRVARARLAHEGPLPRYCERRPAALLDDGWIDESPPGTDALEALESGDDVLIDFGDLEDSR